MVKYRPILYVPRTAHCREYNTSAPRRRLLHPSVNPIYHTLAMHFACVAWRAPAYGPAHLEGLFLLFSVSLFFSFSIFSVVFLFVCFLFFCHFIYDLENNQLWIFFQIKKCSNMKCVQYWKMFKFEKKNQIKKMFRVENCSSLKNVQIWKLFTLTV